MFHYLVMKTEKDLNIGQLFREFRDWREAQPHEVFHALTRLRARLGTMNLKTAVGRFTFDENRAFS